MNSLSVRQVETKTLSRDGKIVPPIIRVNRINNGASDFAKLKMQNGAATHRKIYIDIPGGIGLIKPKDGFVPPKSQILTVVIDVSLEIQGGVRVFSSGLGLTVQLVEV